MKRGLMLTIKAPVMSLLPINKIQLTGIRIVAPVNEVIGTLVGSC